MAHGIQPWSSLKEVRQAARAKLPAPIYDFIDSGCGDQLATRGNVSAFEDRHLVPRIAVDVTKVQASTTILGFETSFPLIIAPMGGLGMVDPDTEIAMARAAAAAGIPFSLSTYSTRSIAEIAANSTGPKLFQLYLLADEGLTQELVDDARDGGFGALAITLDVPAQPAREPVARWNLEGRGGGMPLATKLAFARRPGWAKRQRVLGGIATDVERRLLGRGATIGPNFYDNMIRKNVDWHDVEKVASAWGGPVAVKGVLSGEDARRAIDAGATAIIVCNHGGIALDGAPPTFTLIEEIAEAVAGRAEIIQSGGLRRGQGIAKALALGADACMTGRPFAYGAAAGGEAGVAHVIEHFRRDFEITMKLCGRRSVEELKEMRII